MAQYLNRIKLHKLLLSSYHIVKMNDLIANGTNYQFQIREIKILRSKRKKESNSNHKEISKDYGPPLSYVHFALSVPVNYWEHFSGFCYVNIFKYMLQRPDHAITLINLVAPYIRFHVCVFVCCVKKFL